MGIPSNLGSSNLSNASQLSDSESESGYNSSGSSNSEYSSSATSISSSDSANDNQATALSNPPLSREEADRLYEEAMELEYEKREGGA